MRGKHWPDSRRGIVSTPSRGIDTIPVGSLARYPSGHWLDSRRGSGPIPGGALALFASGHWRVPVIRTLPQFPLGHWRGHWLDFRQGIDPIRVRALVRFSSGRCPDCCRAIASTPVGALT